MTAPLRDDRTELQPDGAATPPGDATELYAGAAPPAQDLTEGAHPTGSPDPTAPSGPPTAAEERTEPQRDGDRPEGGQVPGYRLIQPLGNGTYGEVWLAQEERTGIRVAVKFLARGTGLEWQLIQAEVKQLALLHADPGIVQLLDVDLEARPPYYVMAYAERGSLARRLDDGPLPMEEALGVFRQLAVALAYVHAKGVRHCDIKPGNVLLNARGRPLLADFGQAHLSTDATPALGTFFYMAPEQADTGRQIPDTRWDVYGLGAIFYAMLTGGPPRDDPEARARLAATADLGERLRCYREWVAKAPRPEGHRRAPGMDRRLAEIIDRCLEVDPQKRPHDAGAVLNALARRDRLRRQRPLLAFAFALQILLFLVMGGAAVFAARAGVHRAEAALTEQLRDSDAVAAALVARGLEQEILTRQNILEALARVDALRQAAAARNGVALRLIQKQYRDLAGPTGPKWLLVDARGTLLEFYPNETPRKEFWQEGYFADRDWFNGRGDGAPGAGPIRASHVSHPFIGRQSGALNVGISTPVFAPGRPDEVVAVLFTPVPLKEVHGWLDGVDIHNGFAVLVDSRGHCLRHPQQDKIHGPPGARPPVWGDRSEVFRRAVREKGNAEAHLDPIDGKTYLASYAPLPRVGWGAVVQHDRAAALRPIEELTAQLVYLGVALLLGIPVLLSALWLSMIWVLRRKDRLAQA